jgi:hypothetical protein
MLHPAIFAMNVVYLLTVRDERQQELTGCTGALLGVTDYR